MPPKAVMFGMCFTLIALFFLFSAQEVSAAAPSHVMSMTPDVAGTYQESYYVYFITESQTCTVGSNLHVKGQVFVFGAGSVEGLYIMVTMEDPDGRQYLSLTNATARGIFETDFELLYEVAGNYTITASADATEDHRVDDKLEITVVLPPDEGVKGGEPPTTIMRLGAFLVAFAGMALATTESAGFSLFNIFAFPLYSRLKKEEVLDHFVRGQIYGHIVSNPGVHYNSIREKLKVTNGTLSYHLRTLEALGFIKSRKEGIYRRFYPIEMKFPRNKGVKLSDLQIAILQLAKKRPAPTQKDIASQLNISQQVASYNLRVLAREGYLKVCKERGKKHYYHTGRESPTTV